jgi:hypothetical protein
VPALSLYPTPTATPPPLYEEPAPVAAPPPQEQYVEQAPPPEQQVQQAPPPEQAPPPPQQVPGTHMSGPSQGAAPAPTTPPPTQTPVDTGSATDAIGATAAQIPGTLMSGPSKALDVARATPGAIQEFTGTGDKQRTREHRPADPNVIGYGDEYYRQQVEASEQGLSTALQGGPGNVLNIAGAAKDRGVAQLAGQMGQIFPEQSMNVKWNADRIADQIAHGDPFYSRPEASDAERKAWDVAQNLAFAQEALKDPEGFMGAYTQGQTTRENAVYAPGGEAAWEWYQEGNSGAAKLGSDLLYAPLSTAADVVSTVLTGGGKKLATEALEQGTRLGVRQVGKEVAGKTLMGTGRAIDAAATMGLSEAVPAGFKVLGKGYNALPWVGKQTNEAAAAEAAQTLGEVGGEVLANRRMAEGQQGVPSVTQPSYVTPVGPDPTVVRVAMPPDASGAGGIDLTYKLGTDGQARGVYDVALPGPTDRYRPITTADAEAIYDAWGRLPNADRQAVRQAWFPELSRHETAPGEPFIDQGADRVFDRAGNLIADTGRSGEASRRWVEDFRRTIMRDGRPDQIVTDYTAQWEKTLTDGMLHPLTRRSVAEHGLQNLKDALGGLPAEYRTPEILRHVRQMEDMLPKDAPGSIGTGQKWRGPITGTGGGLAPVTPREQTWLREMAAAPHADFKARLNGGRVGARTGPNLIFDRKPPATAPLAYRNGYTTYLDLEDFRLKNPPSARMELDELRKEVNGLRTAAPTPAAQAREDAIKDVLQRSGIIPNATTMAPDQLVIAIENHLRATKPTFPTLPGARSAPVSGIYPAGSEHERWGMHLDDRVREALEVRIDISGTSRTAGQILFAHWENTAKAYELAKRQAAGVPLSAADARLLDKQVKTIATRFKERERLTGPHLAALPAEEVDRIAANLLKSDMEISQGVRGSTGRMLTPAERKGLMGKALGVYDRFIAMWRSTVLYNPARGIGYPMMQAVGNLATLAIANPGAIPHYVNPRQWRRSLAYLRNPEITGIPNAVRIREKVGLGRTANLGRVSRDQIGARTAFNQEDSHPLTKAIGAIAAPQAMKDLADSWDQSLRHALYQSVFEPAYKRLKRDLTPMAEQRFTDYAARRGVPITITRAQIDTAMKQLERDSGGYFAQPQLRQALYEAAGGPSAANRNVVWDAADRTARDYKEELVKIDKLANAEVDRVAFTGGDTNLEALMQRGFMFTWWVSRASKLYATEAAKSPIQMALWSRALDDANKREQAGTNPRYKFYQEFMATPAGYTISGNPMGLLGGFLLGTTADPTDERNVLTALGEVFNGGWVGDNMVLSPGLRALGHVFGAFGQDDRAPDVFGTNRIEREIIDGLNLVNHHWLQFQKTKGGNPERIAYPGFSQGAINRVAQVLSGKLPGTQQVAGFDPNAAPEGAISSYVTQGVLRDNPDLDPMDPDDAETIRHNVDLAMADHDSALYQEGLGLWTESLYPSAAPGQGSTALDVIGAIGKRWVSPIPISVQPTERTDRLERRGRDALRKEGSQTLTSTPESTEVDKRMGVAGVQSPEGRDLALVRDAALGDPLTRTIKSINDDVIWGDAAEIQATFDEAGLTELDVDGFLFTAQQIASLPEEDRKAIANRFLDQNPAHRAAMDGYYENYNAQLKADKAFADAEGLAKYAKQYPGGIDRFADDTAQVNPNYKRFIEGQVILSGKPVQLPDLRVTDHAAWEAQVTQYDQAASVIAGVKDGRYGLDIDPRYAGVVAGLNEPVGAWLLRQNEEAANEKSPYTADLEKSLTQLSDVGKALDTLDTQWGNPIGTNRAIMAQNILNGALDNAEDNNYALSKETHNALKAMGVSDYFESSTALKNYAAWQLAQPAGADTSVEKYNQAYWAEQNKKAIPEIYDRIVNGQVPALNAEGVAAPYDFFGNLAASGGVVGVGPRPGMATVGQPTGLSPEPGKPPTVEIPAGMPIQTTRRMTGSDGSVWVYVTSGPVGGWVNEAMLTPAA